MLSFSSETQKWPSNAKVFYDEEDKSQLQPLTIDFSLSHLGEILAPVLRSETDALGLFQEAPEDAKRPYHNSLVLRRKFPELIPVEAVSNETQCPSPEIRLTPKARILSLLARTWKGSGTLSSSSSFSGNLL